MHSFVYIAPGVYRLAVPFPGCWTGIVLIRGVENVLIDSGGSAETVDSCIVPALRALGLELSDVSWLVLTHIHGDHVGGCARMCALAPQLRVAVFKASSERIRNPLAYSRKIRARFPQHSPAPPAALDGVVPDCLLGDGDTLAGLTLVHTPGHDTDSCCYWHKGSRTLVTGDSLQLNGTVSQGCALVMDAQGYHASLCRLAEMPIDNIVCGHPYLPLGSEAFGASACAQYLRACISVAEHNERFVRAQMAAGETDALAIARALIREVGGTEPEYMFLPLYTVTAYMHRRSEQP